MAAIRQTVVQTGKEVGRRIPDLQTATLSWLDQYQKGKIVVEVNTADLSREIGKVSQIGQMLAAGMVIAGMIIATGIVFTATLAVGHEHRDHPPAAGDPPDHLRRPPRRRDPGDAAGCSSGPVEPDE